MGHDAKEGDFKESDAHLFNNDQKDVEVKLGFMTRCREKCCKKDVNKKATGTEMNPNLRLRSNIRKLVNGKFVLTLMTFVTLFALIGVSIRIVSQV